MRLVRLSDLPKDVRLGIAAQVSPKTLRDIKTELVMPAVEVKGPFWSGSYFKCMDGCVRGYTTVALDKCDWCGREMGDA